MTDNDITKSMIKGMEEALDFASDGAMETLQSLLSERIDNAEAKGNTGKSFSQIVSSSLPTDE